MSASILPDPGPLNLFQHYLFEFSGSNTRQKENRRKRPALQLHGDPGLRLFEAGFFSRLTSSA